MDTTNEAGRYCSTACRCSAAEGRERRDVAGVCECGPSCACGLCDCAK